MNAGVSLAQTYLHLNGYLTIAEQPVIRGLRGGHFSQVTDLDLIGVRFPGAGMIVTRGRPGPRDDLRLEPDPWLAPSPDSVDVIVAEVKEGKARLNDSARTHDVLYAALSLVGCIPETHMDDVISALQARGEARVAGSDHCVPSRIRLGAFGDGENGHRNGYHVFSLGHVARFVTGFLERYHAVLEPADLADPVLGLLHLLRKLG